MSEPLILASQSEIRQKMLRNAGLRFVVQVAGIDEEILKKPGTPPPEIAQNLAVEKAAAIKADGYIIGADQVLDFNGMLLGKPQSRDEARDQFKALRGKSHQLHSAVAVLHRGQSVFEHTATVTLTMRNATDAFIESYLDRNWPGIASCVGGYKLEEEGSRLFTKIDGDYSTVLGLPLLPLLNFLADQKVIEA